MNSVKRNMSSSVILWAWSLIFIAGLAGESGAQRQTTIYNSFFMTARRTYCNNPMISNALFECFKSGNPCQLPPDMFEYYSKREDVQKKFKQYLTTMCTDNEYKKQFDEYGKCMDQIKPEWADCRALEEEIALEMANKLFSNEKVDSFCNSKQETLLKCYRDVSYKFCASSAKLIFDTADLGNPNDMCNAATGPHFLSLFNLIAAALVVLFSCSFWSKINS